MSNTINENLWTALAYAKRGLYVIPLHTPQNGKCSCNRAACGKSIGKHPRIKAWEDHATIDRATIENWWTQWPDANVGIAVGKSGLVALDCDPEDGGDLGDLPLTFNSRKTWTNLTGSGGEHLIYRKPANLRISNGDAKLPHGINVRGDGGLIVVHPSIHYSGNQYSWEDGYSPFEIDPLTLPESLLPFLSVNGADEMTTKPQAASPTDSNIHEGKRNTTLTSLAGSMRRRGMGYESIVAALQAENGIKCNPPLPENEVREIAKSIMRYEPNGKESIDEQAIHNTDMGNATRLILKHGQDLRYCHPWGKWLIWDGRRWAKDETGGVIRRAKDTVKDIYATAAQSQSESERKSLAKWALQSESKKRLDAMAALAESEVPIKPEDLDTDHWMLNVRNGTLDLRTGDLKAHNPNDLITKLSPVTYDPRATCSTWDAFLNRIMEDNQDLVRFLQRAVGYSLTGDTSEQTLFILHGSGSNGKTTFLHTLTRLLGDYANQTPAETLLIKRSGNIPNDIARLTGTRLVTAVESEKNRRMAESLVKQMTGGDKVAARFLHKEWFEFDPMFKIWLGTNHKPVIKGTDHAIWRRIRLIPFVVEIPEAEQDKRLLDKLTNEFSGILNWAMQGCLSWQQDGLGLPVEVEAATENYRNEMDILGAFLVDCCVVTKTATARAGELYATYREWCETNGERTLANNDFSKQLLERGFDSYRDKRGVIYQGVGLVLDEEAM